MTCESGHGTVECHETPAAGSVRQLGDLEDRRRRWGPGKKGEVSAGWAPALPQSSLQHQPAAAFAHRPGGGVHAELEEVADAKSPIISPCTVTGSRRTPAAVVFTIGHNLVEAQLVEAIKSYQPRTLLDVRSPSTSVASKIGRRVIARACMQNGLTYERLPLDDGGGQAQQSRLHAALKFALAPVALLFADGDPRNGVRRSVSDTLTDDGVAEVFHVTAHLQTVSSARHAVLFQHRGNVTAWPPSRSAVPGVTEVEWPCEIQRLVLAGRRYLFRLPWGTTLLWIPDWLSCAEADTLKGDIEERICFKQPMLRFNRGLQAIDAQQPRRSAWVSDRFNHPERLAAALAAGEHLPPTVLPAHSLEPWSSMLISRAEVASSAKFNALLVHSYDHGFHSMGFHTDSDHGLGDEAVIASLSLGVSRTFAVRSQASFQGRRIQFDVPTLHGSLLVMGPGFQQRWLHAVPKEPDVHGVRINCTFRFYDLPEGSALCACGASKQEPALAA